MVRIKSKRNGGVQSRMGERFYKEIERIKDKRLRNGKSKERVSTEKITNLIVRHSSWSEIADKIIEADEKEVNEHGKGPNYRNDYMKIENEP